MKKSLVLALSALTVLLIVASIGCGPGGRQITKEEEAAWKTPPKQPPAEYKGNVLGTPQGPPPTATQGKK
jgi:hypothetical protein